MIWDLQDGNQHGVWPALLCTANFARVFDADTGDQLFNVTGVPTGTIVQGPNGEQLRYVITNQGNTTNPNYNLALWNSTLLWSGTFFRPGTTNQATHPIKHCQLQPGGTISTPPSTTATSLVNASIFNTQTYKTASAGTSQLDPGVTQ